MSCVLLITETMSEMQASKCSSHNITTISAKKEGFKFIEPSLEKCCSSPPEVEELSHNTSKLALLWDTKQFKQLNVHFLNPEILQREGWMCGEDDGDPVTSSIVLAWATSSWNRHGQKYPLFVDKKVNKKEAQIRIQFSSKQLTFEYMCFFYEPVSENY